LLSIFTFSSAVRLTHYSTVTASCVCAENPTQFTLIVQLPTTAAVTVTLVAAKDEESVTQGPDET